MKFEYPVIARYELTTEAITQGGTITSSTDFGSED